MQVNIPIVRRHFFIMDDSACVIITCLAEWQIGKIISVF